MDAGLMDQRVTLESKSVVRDAVGGETITWSTLATVWARVEVLRGREFVELRAAGSEITTRFTVRYRADVSTVNALTWGTRQYSIVETIPVPSGRPAYLQLLGYADAT
jgi:SPP1 family predicted phage head-tail adaptor